VIANSASVFKYSHSCYKRLLTSFESWSRILHACRVSEHTFDYVQYLVWYRSRVTAAADATAADPFSSNRCKSCRCSSKFKAFGRRSKISSEAVYSSYLFLLLSLMLCFSLLFSLHLPILAVEANYVHLGLGATVTISAGSLV
jgi:hypothetical protein